MVLGEDVPPGCVSFAAVERMGSEVERSALDRTRLRLDDPVEMLYTSGTTGEPKGCLLSHGNMYYLSGVPRYEGRRAVLRGKHGA